MPHSEGQDSTDKPPIDHTEPGSTMERRERKTRALFINDNNDWLRAMGRAFRASPDVVMAECHSVEEAIAAIEAHQPAVVFLDHQLTEGGHEGFDIIERVKDQGIKIISTTGDLVTAEEYRRQGVDHIAPYDLEALRAALEEQTPE